MEFPRTAPLIQHVTVNTKILFILLPTIMEIICGKSYCHVFKTDFGMDVRIWCEFNVSEKEKKKKSLIIQVAHVAHHAPTAVSCNGTSRINMGSHADQSLLSTGSERSFEVKQRAYGLFLLHKACVGTI
jgi:hypothetical protein